MNTGHPAAKILVVDDESVEASIIGEVLVDKGYDVSVYTNPIKALESVQIGSFDIAVTDLRMPSMDGVELLRRLRNIDPKLTVIIMTAAADVNSAVNAMKEGAFDYITKPFSRDHFLQSVDRAFSSSVFRPAKLDLTSEIAADPHWPRLVGDSDAIRSVYDLVTKLAADDTTTVLIQGETGTGKDLVARLIHYMSPRRDMPFVVVNCAAIPEHLMESEFFGHERGAFTGAVRSKAGRFKRADRGTIFLDEIGEMNTAIQAKFLRFLQTKQFERVGGISTETVNVRIIAATNKNLQTEVLAGRFREDLYYRLNVIPLLLTPLRHHKEDIPALVDHFLKQFAAEGKHRVSMTPEALTLLHRYDYPGNIRELQNILERAIVVSNDRRITARELDWLLQASAPPAAEGDSSSTLKDASALARENAERTMILDSLRVTSWNRVRAAKKLGVDYKTLRRKIRQYGLLPGPPE